MSPVLHWNIQFLNLNSQRSYPFTEDVDKQDQTGTITVPDSFIVAMYFPVDAGLDVEPENFYLKQLLIDAVGYTVTIGYNNGADNPDVASVPISQSTHVENRIYNLPGVDDYASSSGRIAIGNTDAINALPPGSYTFDHASTALEVDIVLPMIDGISSITVVDAAGARSQRLVGDIELVADTNMRIVANIVSGQNPEILFSAIEGEGLNEVCVCDEGDTEGTCIRFINGIPPLSDGNYRMVGDDCLTLEPIENGLQLIDECSSPCCGCEEVTALNNQIHRFADGVLTYQNFVSTLSAEVTQMSNIVLGSRLGDSGCLEC